MDITTSLGGRTLGTIILNVLLCNGYRGFALWGFVYLYSGRNLTVLDAGCPRTFGTVILLRMYIKISYCILRRTRQFDLGMVCLITRVDPFGLSYSIK
jgi:hypothetical protein